MHSYIRTPAANMLISTTLASSVPPERSRGDDGHGRHWLICHQRDR